MELRSTDLSSPPASPVVLLVDRDDEIRRLYAEHLKRFHWAIDEAIDGRDALARAITARPDVVVTETRPIGMTGFDLCHLLRKDDATRLIPVVIVSEESSETDLARARATGADSVLVKPVPPEVLALELERIVRQSREIRARAQAVRSALAGQLEKSDRLLAQSHAQQERHRVMLSRVHERRDTTAPPIAPPTLVCPSCDKPLSYLRSHIGGVSERHQEQWDYFECAAGCGEFQYRQRTRKVRKV